MRRVLIPLLAGALVIPGAVLAQSPAPTEVPTSFQVLCVWVNARTGLDIEAFREGVTDGTVAITAVRPCPGLGQSPAPSGAPEATAEPVPSPEPTDPPPLVIPEGDTTFKKLTSREWKKLAKDPDAHDGEYVQVWACITQFDAATGTESFRADAWYRSPKDWLDIEGTNSLFIGHESDLEDFVEGDVALVYAAADGAFSYDTQIGGSTTVPSFLVLSIKHKGTSKYC